MSVPISQMATVALYLVKQKLAGRRRYPLVLMLEPLYRCNLACAGCGKIQYPSNILKSHLSYEDCMRAVDECPTPIVSLPGGEPLLHPEIDRIVRGLVDRKKYVYLCTNGLLLEKKLDLFEPSRYLSFSVHMDGLEEEHDRSVCRKGTYRAAHSAIRAALSRGFRVTTNTTLFADADPARTREFFDEMTKLGVEGMMVSPGYSYDKAPDQSHFLERERTHDLFRSLLSGNEKRWDFNQSPLFLEFLAGERDYDCTPWGNPTYSIFGWQKPCYLLQDGYTETFAELLEATEWERYGPKSGNPKCRNCKVHCGFEASAVGDAFTSIGGLYAMARATLRGPRIRRPQPRALAETTRAPASTPSPAEPAPGQGWSAPASAETLRVAFDYRGDVTLRLKQGEALEGYVANLTERSLVIWSRGEPATLEIPIDHVEQVTLSGRDTASRS